jgi:hypothetical protein
MNAKDFVSGFVLVGAIVLAVTLVVTYLHGLLAHGVGVLEWESSIRFAIILGIALPLIHQFDKKKRF